MTLDVISLQLGKAHANSLSATDRAYTPETRPWFLDLAWEFFLGRYFIAGARNLTTLAASAVVGTDTYTITDATHLTVGNLIFVGDGVTAETQTVQAIVGTTITVHPRARYAHASGSVFGEVWDDAAHPIPGYDALAGFIATAKRSTSLSGTPVLFQSDFTTFYTDVNSFADCPVGWETFGTTSGLTLVTQTWAPADPHPDHRLGDGTTNVVPASVSVATAPGDLTGIRTLASIPVTPGSAVQVTANVKSLSTDYPKLWVVDKNTGATIGGPYTVGTIGSVGFKNLGRRAIIRFTVPARTTDIEVRFGNNVASGVTSGYIDDVRVQVARQATADDRYVIEDPGPHRIVVLSDSWGVQGGYDALKEVLEARIGRSLNMIGASISGQRLDQMNDRFATDVLPYDPAYCIHLSGFQNDIAQNRTQSQIEADVDEFIGLCRANGIIPVVLGSGPTTNGTFSITGALNVNDWVRGRCDLVTI